MQLALTYDAGHAGDVDWSEILAWCRRVVDVIGHKEVAYRLDVQPSQLTDALNERERKDVKAKWLPVLLRLAPDSLAHEYLCIVSRQHSYCPPKRQRPRTPEEELREMREILLRVSPLALREVDKEMGR